MAGDQACSAPDASRCRSLHPACADEMGSRSSQAAGLSKMQEGWEAPRCYSLLTAPSAATSLQPGGFFFCPCLARRPARFPFRALLSRYDRYHRPGKASGPAPFAASLHVQGDTHNQLRVYVQASPPAFLISPWEGSRQICVPIKNRSFFSACVAIQSHHAARPTQRNSALGARALAPIVGT